MTADSLLDYLNSTFSLLCKGAVVDHASEHSFEFFDLQQIATGAYIRTRIIGIVRERDGEVVRGSEAGLLDSLNPIDFQPDNLSWFLARRERNSADGLAVSLMELISQQNLSWAQPEFKQPDCTMLLERHFHDVNGHLRLTLQMKVSLQGWGIDPMFPVTAKSVVAFLCDGGLESPGRYLEVGNLTDDTQYKTAVKSILC
jgi:hypothetical protein